MPSLGSGPTLVPDSLGDLGPLAPTLWPYFLLQQMNSLELDTSSSLRSSFNLEQRTHRKEMWVHSVALG